MPYALTNGIDLYYERAGTGAPVIFVHGGFPSLALALAYVERWDWSWEHDFVRHFDFVWYDRRGCYRSACPDDGYALEDQARDLAGLLDALEIEAAHLVGSSAGGQIALVLHGSDDREVPLAAGADLAQAIPGAMLRVIAGGGHGIIHREPAGRQAAIDFLSGLARSD